MKTAIFLYKFLTAKYPDYREYWLLLGHSFREFGKFDQAAAAYNKASLLAPHDGEADMQLGRMYLSQGELEQSLAHYEAAERLGSDAHQDGSNILKVQFALADAVNQQNKLEPAVLSSPAAWPPDQVFFDVTTLILHSVETPRVTGIQRVEIEILRHALSNSLMKNTGFVFFQQRRGRFLRLTDRFLNMLINSNEPLGAAHLEEFSGIASDAFTLNQTENVTLVSVGYQHSEDYYSTLSCLRKTMGWRYFAFVHDCIPITNPDYMTAGAVREYKQLLANWCDTVDGFMVPSNATGRDLQQCIHAAGLEPISYSRIALAALPSGPSVTEAASGYLASHGLVNKDFVLFVSTIEIRKNHRLAIEAWKRLCSKHGSEKVPRLVFAGKPGWFCDDVMALIEESQAYPNPIIHISNATDAEIQTLYRHCLFTVYPSLKEGWGLPVTESLALGIPVLASDIASLKEAGGELATYFRSKSVNAMVGAAERLIFDDDYREKLSNNILVNFEDRSWGEIIEEIREACHGNSSR